MIGNGYTPEPLISDADLATGIRENQFIMHYQPKIDTRTLEFVSVEAQGFFIARPMPGDQIPGWLKRWNTYLGLAEDHQRASGPHVNLDEMTGTFHRLNSIFPTKLDI